MLRLAALVLLTSLLAIRPANAHPHVFIDWRVEPVLASGAIVSLKLYWRFDDLYSDLVLGTVDRDGDRKLSPPEIDAIAKRTLANLEKGGFYTSFTLDDRPWRAQKAQHFGAEVDGDHVVYIFTFTLPSPAKALTVSSYDPEYYIEMLADKRQVTAGSGFACKAGPAPAVKLDPWGSITPDLVSCSVK